MYERGVAVVGLGYIGLPTSAAIASQGVRVVGVDIKTETVDAVNRGEVPFVEPDLDVAVAGAVARGFLTAQTEMPEADAYLIAVPTPFRDGHEPDLSYVEAASRAIAPCLKGGEVVILESTSPPGTTRRISEWLAEERPDLKLPHDAPHAPDVHIAHCPERVLPGKIMVELVTNDRLVGGLTRECAERASELYRLFCKGEVICTDAEAAEMAKLVENSFRDVNIAFANELANVCESLGLDVWEVIRLANKHPRVNVLSPGPGVGGHCIAVDPWFIVAAAPDQTEIIRKAREINDGRPASVVRRISELAPQGSTVACLGLAFKAEIDDLRESPSVEVTAELARARPDLRILASEPHCASLPPELLPYDNVLAHPGSRRDPSEPDGDAARGPQGFPRAGPSAARGQEHRGHSRILASQPRLRVEDPPQTRKAILFVKQVVQSVGDGHLKVVEVPAPTPGPAEVLVSTTRSLVSTGTEKAVRQLASASLLDKARARPDLVRQVLRKARTEGIKSTVQAVRTRLDEDMPLGYSAAGIVVEVGRSGLRGRARDESRDCFGGSRRDAGRAWAAGRARPRRRERRERRLRGCRCDRHAGTTPGSGRARRVDLCRGTRTRRSAHRAACAGIRSRCHRSRPSRLDHGAGDRRRRDSAWWRPATTRPRRSLRTHGAAAWTRCW